MVEAITVRTSQQTEIISITNEVQRIVSLSKIKNGICIIYVPHTTAGITINEDADPSVKKDILKELNKIIPFDDNYFHMEGNSAAHIKSTVVGMSKTVIIKDRKLLLGTWQGIFFCEFDGPRTRKVYVQIVPE